MDKETQIYPVILAGGTGSRLWPLSRQLNPKQFLCLTDNSLSLLQTTLQRLQGIQVVQQSICLICNEEHRFLAAEQIRQMQIKAEILLEPIGRNTAPAVTLAALRAQAAGQDPLLLVLAADHLIKDTVAFHQAVEQAQHLAKQGKLVTFGVQPTHAETGYGYIERGQSIAENAYTISRFVEKPDLETAESYLQSGNFFWNSGMFMFKASRYLQELEALRPDILQACQQALKNSIQDMDFIRIDTETFKACPEDSIDYAVMEHTQDAVVVPLNAGWSDIGSWSALWETGVKDSQGNVCKGDVLTVNTNNSYLHSEHRLVASLGVENLVIVETKDAVLVAHKDQAQEVKQLVELLKQQNRQEHLNHREVYRPWGVYDAIDQGHRYQVKRITVKPGGKLSLQMHHHRAEHWVVVSGTAKVTKGEETYLVAENQSTFIPVGTIHSLENPGKITLEIIEVQSGSYLNEDDIIRISDQYGR